MTEPPSNVEKLKGDCFDDGFKRFTWPPALVPPRLGSYTGGGGAVRRYFQRKIPGAPSGAAGVTDKLHDMAWLVELIDAAAPAPKPRGP